MCALLYVIVLVLFIFCAEESLSEETIQQSKEVKKAMGVGVTIDAHSERAQCDSAEVVLEELHFLRAAARGVRHARQLCLHVPQPGPHPLGRHLRHGFALPDVVRHHLPADADEQSGVRRVRDGRSGGELDRHHRRRAADRFSYLSSSSCD